MKQFRVLIACLAASALVLLAESHVTLQGADVAIWKPTASPSTGGYPVILFSHGFAGCNTQSRFLMQALAGAGYVVVAPNHDDAHCSPRREGFRLWRYLDFRQEKRFNQPGDWSDETYRARSDDIRRVLDALVGRELVGDVPIDRSRIGVAGHSLGGYTALGLAGAWPSWRDRRIKAVLAMSPYTAPYLVRGDLANLRVPVMYQGGSLDWGITPMVRKPGGAYERTAAPKYYVELSRAGHLAWTNLAPVYHGTISDYAVAFFDRYLKELPEGSLDRLTKKPWPSHVRDVRLSVD